MKRFIAASLMFLIITMMITGCSEKSNIEATNLDEKKISESTDDASIENSNDSKVDNENSYSEKENDVIPGTELSTFMANYMDAKSNIWDAMDEKFNEDPNNPFIFGAIAFAFADLSIIEVGLFDMLTLEEGDVFKGKLMFSNIDAWKKVNSDIIEFGYDYTFTEDNNQSLKGDHQVANGRFDKSNDSLIYEHYTERNGKKISSYIVEITKNSDSSYSSQLYSLDTDIENANETLLTGLYTWFEGKDIVSIIAEKENAEYDFNFTSIFNKKNIKAEEMVEGMNIKTKVSFIDGEALYEDFEN